MENRFETEHLPQIRAQGPEYIARIPEVQRFLDTDLFDSITLIKTSLLSDLAHLEFDVQAPKLMPHPRARLLEHGLVKRHNLLHSAENPDIVRQTIGFFGNSLQIALNFQKATTGPDNNGQK